MSSISRRAFSKLINLLNRAADPAITSGQQVAIYAKNVGSSSQLFARTSDNTISQITPIAQVGTTVTFAMTPYTILPTDNWLFVNTTGGPIDLQLPNPALFTTPKSFRVIDITGTMATNNCFLLPFGAELVEGLNNNKRLQTAWGGWTVVTNLTNWFLF